MVLPMQLDVRKIETGQALELYVTATPEPGQDPQAEVKSMFAAVSDVVRSHGARVCRERVFVPDGCLRPFHSARHAAYPAQDPPVATDWLMAGGSGPVGGIQVHAVKGPTEWKPLRSDAGILGWSFRQNGTRWAVTGGLCVPDAGDGPHQAKAVFEAGEALLSQVGMNLHSVARTWIFMDDILSWYGPFNEARNRLFIKRGMLQRGSDASKVPASTGMGVTPVCPARCSIEMFAVDGSPDVIKRYTVVGKQRCAFEYGSAFARASAAPTPAGRAVFISGTASIDESGATVHINDHRCQIRFTIQQIISILKETKTDPRSVVQAIAYCKTPEIAESFRRDWLKEVAWPWVIVIGDVCRNDLLFEAEVTACEAPRGGAMN